MAGAPPTQARADVMPTIVVNVNQLPERLKFHVRAVERDLIHLARHVVRRGRTMARAISYSEDIIASRRYVNSFVVNTTYNGASLSNTAPYADVIEFGRRPGATPPPIAAIERWMAWKEWVPDRRAAALIASKIGHDGIPPKRVLGRVAARLGPMYVRVAEKWLRRR